MNFTKKGQAFSIKTKYRLALFAILLLCLALVHEKVEFLQNQNRLRNALCSQLVMIKDRMETVTESETYSDYAFDHGICTVSISLLKQLKFAGAIEGASELETMIEIYDRVISNINQKGFSQTQKEQYVRLKSYFDELQLSTEADISKREFENVLKHVKEFINSNIDSFTALRDEVLRNL